MLANIKVVGVLNLIAIGELQGFLSGYKWPSQPVVVFQIVVLCSVVAV